MTITLTTAPRTVILDIRKLAPSNSHPTASNSRAELTSTEEVLGICVVIDDGKVVTEITLENRPEKELLRQFWQLVQPHDVFYGRNIASCLALLRRATWRLNLIPSRGVDLRAVYQCSIPDPAGALSTCGDDEYRSAEVLIGFLELPEWFGGRRTRCTRVSYSGT